MTKPNQPTPKVDDPHHEKKEYKIDVVNGIIPTPDQFVGPYYPAGEKPVDGGNDMSHLPGREPASGEVISVFGKVVNLHDEPCPDVKIEIWQSNARGKYIHRNDHNPVPIDPNFDGYANIVTDSKGHYRFKTVMPASYPVTPEFWRPPHIHYDIVGRVNRLVTQMYFPDEPLNDKDPILQVAWFNESLIAKVVPPSPNDESGIKQFEWDIILIEG